MASFDPGTFMKLWYQDDAASRYLMAKALQAGIDQTVQQQSGVIKKLRKGAPIDNPEVTWMEEVAYPHTITATLGNSATTLTVSGNLFGAAVTQASIQRVLRVGTILERPAGGGQVKVTAMTGITDGSAPWVATVAAYGNTSPADDGGAVTWRIVSEVWSDMKEADTARSIGRTTRKVGTQIHAEVFEIPKTRENTKYENVTNETEHQIKLLLEKLTRQLGYAVLLALPYYSAGTVYGTVTEEPTMRGILNWTDALNTEAALTNTYVNAAGAAVTKTMLNDLVRNHWLDNHADYNTGDWWLVTDPITHEYMHDFDITFRDMSKEDESVGFHVNAFDSKMGKKFKIMSDQYMRSGVIQLVNFANLSYGYYKNDEMDRKELATQGRFRRRLISFQTYGVVARMARQTLGAQIYGLPTS